VTSAARGAATVAAAGSCRPGRIARLASAGAGRDDVAVWCAAVVVGALATAPAPPAITPARIDAARAAVLDDDYQPEMPHAHGGGGHGGHAVGPRRPGDRLIEPADGDRGASDGEDVGFLGGLVRYLLWGLVLIAAAIGGLWLARELSRFAGDGTGAGADDDGARDAVVVDPGILDRPLGDADELARLGRFAEAIHTLLLRTLQELARQAALHVAPAETSREILARVPLHADARAALGGLITAVEVTHFGADVAGPDDYERCRHQFHRFATAVRGATS
jgi:Domain of unknown function (DUF4129)